LTIINDLRAKCKLFCTRFSTFFQIFSVPHPASAPVFLPFRANVHDNLSGRIIKGQKKKKDKALLLKVKSEKWKVKSKE